MTLRTALLDALDPLPEGALVPVDWVRGLVHQHDGEPGVDLTVRDVAQMLDRAPSTIRRWAGAGDLPGAYRLQDREWRIPRSALVALRERGQEEPGQTKRGRSGPIDLSGWREEGVR